MSDADVFVTSINNPEIKKGFGSNNKPWSMAHVQLNTGETAYIFNPIAIGDPVMKQKTTGKDGKEYENWVRKRIDKNDEIANRLDSIDKRLSRIEAALVSNVVDGNIADDGSIHLPAGY
jgi:hypothetical protein